MSFSLHRLFTTPTRIITITTTTITVTAPITRTRINTTTNAVITSIATLQTHLHTFPLAITSSSQTLSNVRPYLH